MTTPPVRVRFAPSPTGFLHVGGVRTALWNWLFARRHGGTFVLRIEDTDDERNREEWVDGICEGLRWVGVDWDEFVRQSDRSDRYDEAAGKLQAAGLAYWCECTREQVEERAERRGGPPGYDGFCRDRSLGPGAGRALRFRTPDEGATVVHDVVRGDPAFDHTTIEDFVIVRSSGRAIFVLANAVDDLDLGITHVIRGEEHLPTTPKYLLLWEALGGGRPPVFAHVPLIVNEKRQKLSKRRDPVALELYRSEGYLPEVMASFLAHLGWGDPDDTRDVAELVPEFRLEDVNSSPSYFDLVKLRSLNGDRIRALPREELVARARPFLPAAWDLASLGDFVDLVQERVARLDEVASHVDFLFGDDLPVDDAAWAKAMREPAPALLDAAISGFQAGDWDPEAIKRVLLDAGLAQGLPEKKAIRAAQAPVRMAVTGRSVGPPLFESLALLGRDRVLARLRAARARL
ncbi:MAG TPA: glutamate--tRNA ligase [Acidimicrobiales bacterium]